MQPSEQAWPACATTKAREDNEMDVVSLLIFVAIIIIAFFRKNNIGVLALAAGVIAVRILG